MNKNLSNKNLNNILNNNEVFKKASKTDIIHPLYLEHYWDLNKIICHFSDSNINKDKIEKSTGLSHAKANELLKLNGPNKLPVEKKINNLKLFLSQFLNLMWILLISASILSFIGYLFDNNDIPSLLVSIILFFMIIIMCFISFYQEREALRVVQGFENLLPLYTVVIREGSETIISAETLVVGDIIKLKSGTKVGADARILHCVELKVETSSLTGESEPVEHQSEAVQSDVTIFEAHNVVFNGSMCTDGEGIAVVIKTGTNTMIGQIATLTINEKQVKSHLEIQIKNFVKFLTFMAIAVAIISCFIGFLINVEDVRTLLLTSFTVCAVAMIPEGLPSAITFLLTLIAKRLAKKNVYLKRLDIVETLGSANIIGSDKTGTLTKNKMTVTDLWYSNEYITEMPNYKFYENQRTFTINTISQIDSPLSDLLIAMTICNTASFDKSQITNNNNKDVYLNIEPKNNKKTSNFKIKSKKIFIGEKNVQVLSNQINTMQRRKRRLEFIQGMKAIGAPSEIALIKYAEQLIDVHKFRRKFNVIFEIPFNSKRKFHLVLAKVCEINSTHSQYLMIVKGAPEIIIERCLFILSNNGEIELNNKEKQEFQTAYNLYGEQGRRVIGFAHKFFNDLTNADFKNNEDKIYHNLTFLGICAIMDPPRDETSLAIKQCKEAGIKVFMITGDHHITAQAIALEIGLINNDPNYLDTWEIVKSENISKLSSSDWDRIIKRQNVVFARTTPQDKFCIVEECQRRNQIIAMTGDGVNDKPALKKANIGVCMGSGSDVAKQASDIILMDDNFFSVVGAVEEGRLMFDNIKKMMIYLLTHAVPELWAILIYYFFGMPKGISTLMILGIDLGTEIFPSFALYKEHMENDIMKVPPIEGGKKLTNIFLYLYCYGYMGHIQALSCFCAYCYVFIGEIDIRNLFFSQNKFGTNDFFNIEVEKQKLMHNQAKTAWLIGIVIGQVFHIYSARTLRQSIFKHGLFSNKTMNLAIIIEISILLIYIYVPFVSNYMESEAPPLGCWLIVCLFGIFVFTFNELRKYAIRHWPENFFVCFFKL